MIHCNHIAFSYKKTLILNDISFDVAQGEFIGIVGPNGGGKTTLLKLLLGLLLPQKGHVLINNKPPRDALTSIGYAPQLVNFDEDFPITTFELVLMGCLSHLTIWGTYSPFAKHLAEEALHKVGLYQQRNVPFGKLSGGQARRALIARAIVNAPSILILDEPTANIDIEAESSICNLLISLKKEMTMLMVTHELPGIIPHVDRVFCIQKTLSILNPAEVCEHTTIGVYHQPHKGDPSSC